MKPKQYDSPVFFVPGNAELAPNVIDVAKLRSDGTYVGLWTNKSIDELRLKHPTLQMGESDEVRDAKEALLRTDPVEISQDDYHHALCVLPPMDYKANGIGASFKCEERISGRITAIYAAIGHRCFTFNGVATMPHAEVMARVMQVIELQESASA